MATKSISQLDTAASVSASDLYEVAIPDVQSASGYASKKESGAQIATFFHNGVQNNNLNTTNKTLVGAINEVDEDSVKWTEQNFLGAKNLLPYPYYDNSGITGANVKFTVDENGWVHCQGTATGNAIFTCSSRSVNGGMFLPNGTYIVSGCPAGGSTSTSAGSYQLGVSATIDGGIYNYCYEAGDGAEFTVNGDDFSNDGAWVSVRVICRNTVVSDNLVFKPMIRLASIADENYAPPSETNRELTLYKCSMSSIANVENSDTASNAYSIGDYMFWRGGFYKVTAAITQGGAITSGTNVTATTIGAELKAALS